MNTARPVFTSLRVKSARVIAVMFFIAAFATYVILDIILMNAVNTLESRYVAEHVVRASNAIASETDNLTHIAFDWAVWDDTYQYVRNENAEYVSNNLGEATFANLKLNAMLYINEAGQYVFAGAMDQSTGEMVPVSNALLAYIDSSQIIRNDDPAYKPSGIIMLPEGPMLIASSPILKSDESGPVHGNLVVGYYLDEARVNLLSEQLEMALAVETASGNLPGDSDLTGQPGYDGFAGQPNAASPVSTVALSDSSIAGSSIINDISGKPALKLTVMMDRDVSAIGRDTIKTVIILLITVSLVFTFFILMFMNRTILLRLQELAGELRLIGRERLFSSRLEPQITNDELAIVTDEINNMLDELESAQLQIIASEKALKIANEELESKVQERTTALSQTNEKLEAEIKVREEIQSQVKHLAYHDHLTGLPNRLLMTEHIDHAIHVASRWGKELAVMFLDLDGFKMINDTFGHAAGDTLLRAVAERLVCTLRKSDIVARIGGDEFIILVEDIDNTEAVNLIAYRILKCFDQPFVIDNREHFITTSVGVAMFPEDGREADVLIKNADIAMYTAKERGKNQCVLCTPVMKNTISEMMLLANTLHRSLEKDELELYYQPQISCSNSRMVGVEALIRWEHPELGMLSPGRFISLAEQSGLINPIGEWVIKTACRQNKAWQDAGYPPIRMAVNLSVKQFQDNNLVQKVADILKETGLKPQYLELEVTENIAMKEKEHFVPTLNEFRKMGISIAIDDFGTEYSSLLYLTHLPIDRVKIAMPFVQGIKISEKDEAITKAILLLAKSMELGVIAEGVETETQFAFLCQRRCDEVQGFYFYKPMPAFQIEELLKESS